MRRSYEEMMKDPFKYSGVLNEDTVEEGLGQVEILELTPNTPLFPASTASKKVLCKCGCGLNVVGRPNKRFYSINHKSKYYYQKYKKMGYYEMYKK